ncbi:hypothetical protein P168DRAFT_278689 [Aspergillus campestris IBT 28561]|uniref:Uncharacterized protein n=1 Tax=Aspergillus campestris (strain IBT 28561) TaxID=1392248 RepID=A0A2I1DH37_ASPC2|nr:uncharacterized protein P168DRAFT_278689 [Aspergillus campestris IBT 28561]PKY09185.1 hypothetical protein P168DRAFT_278689 [Aspergillus campestris IBT 28561]
MGGVSLSHILEVDWRWIELNWYSCWIQRMCGLVFDMVIFFYDIYGLYIESPLNNFPVEVSMSMKRMQMKMGVLKDIQTQHRRQADFLHEPGFYCMVLVLPGIQYLNISRVAIEYFYKLFEENSKMLSVGNHRTTQMVQICRVPEHQDVESTQVMFAFWISENMDTDQQTPTEANTDWISDAIGYVVRPEHAALAAEVFKLVARVESAP